MAQGHVPFGHPHAQRFAHHVGLFHAHFAAGRQVALAQVREQERRLALGDLGHARDRRPLARGERREPRLPGRRLGIARDRVAVGARHRPPEHLVQALLDHIGDRVLEAGRLGVGGHPVQAEAICQPALHDAVPADDRLGRPHPARRQLDLLAPVHPHQTVAGHPAQSDRDRRAAHPEPVRQPRAPQRLLLEPHVVDGLEVARHHLRGLADGLVRLN